ncbi:hypothetical protein WN944_014624 [Citrus x changshan-huyou]|uniref:Uncharacterized protein n=1 Tax=Citrus x changshan-huyou TaxID=2935761 RepID=A0AAP0M5X1_9ROSI
MEPELEPDFVKTFPHLVEDDRQTKKARFKDQAGSEESAQFMSFKDKLM